MNNSTLDKAISKLKEQFPCFEFYFDDTKDYQDLMYGYAILKTFGIEFDTSINFDPEYGVIFHFEYNDDMGIEYNEDLNVWESYYG